MSVYIAMPVYRGADVIEETIRSILDQTYGDFHLVMSVDGADDPTGEVCRKYEQDSRIDVVVQDRRLGWPGNFNWLVNNCDREFFCYWQQDDFASTGYLENLRRELLARPDASIAYTDVQWFGARFDRTNSPSIEGDDPLSRVMQHIEAIRYEPLRGLIRSSMLPQRADPIPVTADESSQEEFVFLADLAAAGPFLRVDSAMYFKRLHGENSFMRWQKLPAWRRRREWISMGAAMYRVARNLAAPELWPLVLGHVLDRLAVDRPGRAYFHVPHQSHEEIGRFVHDFVASSEIDTSDLGTEPVQPGPLDHPISKAILDAMSAERSQVDRRSDFARVLTEERTLTIDFSIESSWSLLGAGWNTPENWGVWSDAQEVSIRVPVAGTVPWRGRLTGRVFPDTRSVRIGSAVGDRPFDYVEVAARDPVKLTLESSAATPSVIRLHLPDASSPLDEGISEDGRLLGVGLERITLDLVDGDQDVGVRSTNHESPA
jgi:Glycosyl transferase family 2